jgi:hypothetical protein
LVRPLSDGVQSARIRSNALAQKKTPIHERRRGTSATAARCGHAGAEKVGGFDAKRALTTLSVRWALASRPSGSTAITQRRIICFPQLSADGCSAETDAFNAKRRAARGR